MTISEFSDQFDVLYNNITSNQAPGLDEYEKSLFLTKAEKEIVKNYFSPNSKGNTLGQGFDDSAKRQADFSVLMETGEGTLVTGVALTNLKKIDDRSIAYTFPRDTFIVVNETVRVLVDTDVARRLQVIPVRYDEYTRLMSKPFKRPLKNQAWRIINSGEVAADTDTTNKGTSQKTVELIVNSWDEPVAASGTTPAQTLEYSIRYVRVPKPIILAELGTLTIDGEHAQSAKCEIDPILHEDILQRAVELAKIAWTATGQDNTNAVLAAGQRSE